jgi:hypothetical protein
MGIAMNGWLAPEMLALLFAVFAMLGWCLYRIVRRRSSAAVFKDWSIYLAVGVAVVLGAILFARANVDPMGWITPLATAAFVFGFSTKSYWPSIAHSVRFWLTISILLIAHFLFFFRVLSPIWRWNPTLIAIVGIPELFVSYMALIIVLGPPPKPPE